MVVVSLLVVVIKMKTTYIRAWQLETSVLQQLINIRERKTKRKKKNKYPNGGLASSSIMWPIGGLLGIGSESVVDGSLR